MRDSEDFLGELLKLGEIFVRRVERAGQSVEDDEVGCRRLQFQVSFQQIGTVPPASGREP